MFAETDPSGRSLHKEVVRDAPVSIELQYPFAVFAILDALPPLLIKEFCQYNRSVSNWSARAAPTIKRKNKPTIQTSMIARRGRAGIGLEFWCKVAALTLHGVAA
jgi:hypothetical protein